MILQLPNIGNGGRMGNALFTIASTIGIALRHGYTPRFPKDWKYRNDFNIPAEWFGDIVPAANTIKENSFSYCDLKPRGEVCSIIQSYLQSPLYWAGYEAKIRQYLTPKECLPFLNDMVCIHHRRGDYIGNSNYRQLGWGYYLSAYDKHFAGKEVLGLSDDLAFVKMHYLRDGRTEIQDFIAACECSYHIVSNSTFAWWAAYLSRGKVVRPTFYFAGELSKNSTADFWPKEWIEHYNEEKLTAKDVGVIIPVQYDHPDRLENLKTVVGHIQQWSNIDIAIGEINGNKMNMEGCQYHRYSMQYFHRTYAINQLTRAIDKPIVFNLDCDVMITPWQFYNAIYKLRNGYDVVWPYDGSFRGVNRQLLADYDKVKDMVIFEGQKHRLMGYHGVSWGGVVAYRTDKFFEAGGENEFFIAYNPEDQERHFRFESLGLKLARVAGPLFHLDHWRGPDSGMRHPHARIGHELWELEKKLKPHQVKAMVEGEHWNKDLDINHVRKYSTL